MNNRETTIQVIRKKYNHEVKHYRRKRTYNEDAFLINFKKDLKN